MYFYVLNNETIVTKIDIYRFYIYFKSQNLTENVFFFQSLWWERRVFPLKDEDKDALCQDEKHNENERSSPILPGEVFCTFTSDNSHHPKSHTDGMDYRTFGLGLTYVKKNR